MGIFRGTILGMGDAPPHRRDVRDRQTRQIQSALLQDSFAKASDAYDNALGGYEAVLAGSRSRMTCPGRR